MKIFLPLMSLVGAIAMLATDLSAHTLAYL